MDISVDDIENEGIINHPNADTSSMTFFKNKKILSSLISINSLSPHDLNDFPILTENLFDFEEKTDINEGNMEKKIDIKNADINSATTKSSLEPMNDKIKKVTFSTVEIIRIENYKKYNKMNIIKKNENNNTSSDNNCMLF